MKLIFPVRGAAGFDRWEFDTIDDILDQICQKALQYAMKVNARPKVALLGPREFYSLNHAFELQRRSTRANDESFLINGPLGPLEILIMEKDGIEFGFTPADISRVVSMRFPDGIEK